MWKRSARGPGQVAAVQTAARGRCWSPIRWSGEGGKGGRWRGGRESGGHGSTRCLSCLPLHTAYVPTWVLGRSVVMNEFIAWLCKARKGYGTRGTGRVFLSLVEWETEGGLVSCLVG